MADTGVPLTLDTRALDELAAALGPEDALTVIDMMVASVPEAHRQLQAAAASGDLDIVERLAHQLKSDCAYVGATALGGRLQELETRAGSGLLPNPTEEVERLEAQLTWFVEALRITRNARAAGIVT